MIIAKKILYKGWSTLYQYTIKHFISDREFVPVEREIYDSGDGAAALLYNKSKRTVILIRQFRLAAFLNGLSDGMIIETCAGMLDGNNPEKAIMNEILEETGYKVKAVFPIGSVYATPGAHMEKVELFICEYDESMRVSEGGGLAEEHENIEVLEFSFDQIKEMVENRKILDSKTLILLQHALLQKIIE
jgi:nudix-type nucleoside diphosphatase (YffH/AdpP family)